MFAIYDAVRVVEFESRSARPDSPVVEERAQVGALWSARARLAVSERLHHLADALAPNREMVDSRFSPDPCRGC